MENNTPEAAEAIVLLELVEVLERRGRHVEEGKITIGIENRKECDKLVNIIRKTSDHAQNAGAEIAQIKKVTNKIKHEIKIKLVKGHPKRIGPRREEPIAHLMKNTMK